MTSTPSAPRPDTVTTTAHSIGRRAVLGAAALGAASASLLGAAARPAPAHAAAAPTDDSGDGAFTLVWEDDFSGGVLDQNTWEHELGNIRGNEQQHYSSSLENVRVEDSLLILEVTDRPEQDQYRNTERHGDAARLVKYNSGSVRTHGHRDFLYGKLEVRARLPRGKGVFPAIWTLGHDFPLDGRISGEQGYGWPATGEIDIAEIIGAPTAERAAEGESGGPGNSNRTLYGTPHFWFEHGDVDGDGTYAPYALGGVTSIEEDFAEDFHVFGVNRTPDKLEWLLDGQVYRTLLFDSEDPADQARRDAARAGLNRPAYLQINLATGGNWAGDAGDHLAEDGARVEVDWVRFSQTPGQQAQDAAYRAGMPELEGVRDVAIRTGEPADLTEGFTVDRAGYEMEISVNDSPMFVNTGAPGGRNEVRLRVGSADDAQAVADLPEGVYALYATALPTGADLTGGQVPTELTARRSATLTVLPEQGLTGDPRSTVATVDLPEGHRFRDESLRLNQHEEFLVDFTNPLDPIPGAERPVRSYVLAKESIDLPPISSTRGNPHPGKGKTDDEG